MRLMAKRLSVQELLLVVLEMLKVMCVGVLPVATSGLMEIRQLPGPGRLAGKLMSMVQEGMWLVGEEWRPTVQIRWSNAARRRVSRMLMEMLVA